MSNIVLEVVHHRKLKSSAASDGRSDKTNRLKTTSFKKGHSWESCLICSNNEVFSVCCLFRSIYIDIHVVNVSCHLMRLLTLLLIHVVLYKQTLENMEELIICSSRGKGTTSLEKHVGQFRGPLGLVLIDSRSLSLLWC